MDRIDKKLLMLLQRDASKTNVGMAVEVAVNGGAKPGHCGGVKPGQGHLGRRHRNGPDRGHFYVGGGDFDQGVVISPVSRSAVRVAWFCSAADAVTRRRAADCLSR